MTSSDAAMQVKIDGKKNEEYEYQLDNPENTFSVSSNINSYCTIYAPRFTRRMPPAERQPFFPSHPNGENFVMLPQPMKVLPLGLNTLLEMNKQLSEGPLPDKVEMKCGEVAKEENFVKLATVAMEEYFENPGETAFRLTASLEKEALTVQMCPMDVIRKCYGSVGQKNLRRHFGEEPPRKKGTEGKDTLTWRSVKSRESVL